MSCAAFAAEAGAKVMVVEKQSQVGGSSAYSAGMLYVHTDHLCFQDANPSRSSWAPKTYDSLRAWVPKGDPDLQKAWLSNYLPAVQWMREKGVPTSNRFEPIMTIGISRKILPITFD